MKLYSTSPIHTLKLKDSSAMKETNTADKTDNAAKGGYQPNLEMQAVIKNAIASGKYTQDEMDAMTDIATDNPEIINSIREMIRIKPMDKVKLDGNYPSSMIKLAADNTYDDIYRHEPGGFNTMKATAPELYKAKHFEKYGRLPAEVK